MPFGWQMAEWKAEEPTNPWTAKSEKQEWQEAPNLLISTRRKLRASMQERRVHRERAGSQHLTRWVRGVERISGTVAHWTAHPWIMREFCRKGSGARNMYSICLFLSTSSIHSFFINICYFPLPPCHVKRWFCLIYKLYTHTHTPPIFKFFAVYRGKQVTEKQKLRFTSKREVEEMWRQSVKDLELVTCETFCGNIGGLMVPQSVLVIYRPPLFLKLMFIGV